MSGRAWTAEEIELLEACYEDTPTAELAELLGCSVARVWAKARAMGLRKSLELIAAMAAERTLRPDHGARATRFPKGHVPANKGLRTPGYAPGRMKETQFKKGEVSHTWKPLHSTRLCDGYLYLKIADVRNVPWTHNWKPAHVLLWETEHGPVPHNHTVTFKDGDKLNVVLENLELLSRRELMLRNTVHNLPKPLVEVIMLNGALKRKLRRMDRAQKQDD